MNKNIILAVVITAAVIGGGAFYGGMKYGESKNKSPFARGDFQSLGGGGQNRQNGIRTPGASGQNGELAAGEVISKDDGSLTVKTAVGSKIVFISGSTEISKSVSGSLDDLEIGQNLVISGTANSDGSITAKTVQIRPEMPVGGQGQAQNQDQRNQ